MTALVLSCSVLVLSPWFLWMCVSPSVVPRHATAPLGAWEPVTCGSAYTSSHHFTEWGEEKRLIKGQEDENERPQTPDSDVTPGW
jgi:hypothetical protein